MNDEAFHHEVDLGRLQNQTNPGHVWHLQGTRVAVCVTCANQHAQYANPGHMFINNQLEQQRISQGLHAGAEDHPSPSVESPQRSKDQKEPRQR